MKTIILISIMFLTFAFLTRCTKKEVADISISEKEITLSSTEFEKIITVSSSKEWHVDGPNKIGMYGPPIVTFDNWLEVSVGGGIGVQNITLSVRKNAVPAHAKSMTLSFYSGSKRADLAVYFTK